jgi:hypothetical protein
MKTGKPVQEMARLVLGLATVAAITIAIISTLRRPAPGSATAAVSPDPTSSPQQPATPPQEPTTEIPYPYPNPFEFFTSTAAARQTAAGPLNTQYAIMLATDLATTPSPTPPRTFSPTGTLEGERVKPSGKTMGLDAQNAWYGLLDGRPVSVHAGALSEDSSQGAIFISAKLLGPGVNELILTPTKHGGVRVVSEHNNRLTLVSTDGTTYYFDIPSLSYVSSLTVFAPSITPPPARTPIPPNYVTETPTPYPPPYNPYPNP